MTYGTKDCPKCEGSGKTVHPAVDCGMYNGPIGETIKCDCIECDGEGWVVDEDVDDVCLNCGGSGDVRAYHGDCDVTNCPDCKGTGKGCFGSNNNAPHECRCERCTDHLADKADMLYDQMREGD